MLVFPFLGHKYKKQLLYQRNDNDLHRIVHKQLFLNLYETSLSRSLRLKSGKLLCYRSLIPHSRFYLSGPLVIPAHEMGLMKDQ